MALYLSPPYMLLCTRMYTLWGQEVKNFFYSLLWFWFSKHHLLCGHSRLNKLFLSYWMSHHTIKPRRILFDTLHLGVISSNCVFFLLLIFDVDNASTHKFLESVYSVHIVLREVGCSLQHYNKIGKRREKYELTPLPVSRERLWCKR